MVEKAIQIFDRRQKHHVCPFFFRRGSSAASDAGLEPHSEYLASSLLDEAGVDHVRYELIKYHQKTRRDVHILLQKTLGM